MYQIVQSAVEQDSRLQQARSQIGAADALIDAAKASYLPTLSLQANADRNDRWGRVTEISLGEDRGLTSSLQIRWNLFRSGADLSHVAEAKEDFEVARAELRRTRLEVLRDLILAMLEYRKYAALILSATQYGDQTREFAKHLDRSRQLGQTSALEMERALARNQDGMQSLQRFLAQRDAAATALLNRFDLPIGGILPPLTAVSALSAIQLSAGLEDSEICNPDRLAGMPAIVQREAELAVRQHQVSAERAQYGPRVDLQLMRNSGRHAYDGLTGGLSEKEWK
ncbi:TolC family protein [Cupriavidus sp. D39]|uniref:TolC family protein n=1 Tax=Cupriavidus sp. D39 TaxID=2997877 RepID=UPI0022712658|nr:TolC family protein [Cupriavidus sp. D39]MCY0858653.1 TolC family protein [Cupriavidus sp. D39]